MKDLCKKWKVKLYFFLGDWNSFMIWPDWPSARPPSLFCYTVQKYATGEIKGVRQRSTKTRIHRHQLLFYDLYARIASFCAGNAVSGDNWRMNARTCQRMSNVDNSSLMWRHVCIQLLRLPLAGGHLVCVGDICDVCSSYLCLIVIIWRTTSARVSPSPYRVR